MDRSSGVFLWVFLVVRSLLRGLDNQDTLSELTTRLREMPSDLLEFFQRMLDSIDRNYQAQSARLFQLRLVEAADYSLMTLSFFDENDLNFALEMPSTPWSGEELSQWQERAMARIRARCMDLLEVKPCSPGESRLHVHFLHRTVRDFLMESDVQRILQTRLISSMRPETYFAAAFLAQVKMYNARQEFFSMYQDALSGVLASCFHLDHVLKEPCRRILDELDTTLVDKIKRNEILMVMGKWGKPNLADTLSKSLILQIALNNHLDRYIQDKVTSNVEALTPFDRSLLLRLLVNKMRRQWEAGRESALVQVSENGTIETWKRLQHNDVLLHDVEGLTMNIEQMKCRGEGSQLTSEQLVVALLEKGADPNACLSSVFLDDRSLCSAKQPYPTAWVHFLQNTLSTTKHLPQSYLTGLLQAFLEHGANQHAEYKSLNLFDIIQEACGKGAKKKLEAWLKTYNHSKSHFPT